jgi:hypothetical protein
LVETGGSVDDWLDACDVHISTTSTVLSEAVLFGRGNVVIGGRRFGDSMGCLAEGMAVDLDGFAGLEEAVDFWLGADEGRRGEFEEKRRGYIERHFYRLDGKVGERIAAVVEEAWRQGGRWRR